MPDPATNPEFEALLDSIRQTRGFNFTAYKRASLVRRFEKRMQVAGVESYAAYADVLQTQPEEYTALFNTILINVTSFFRDPAAWGYISSDVLPLIAQGKKDDEAIRMWSAGCASGEEAYTLAMVAAECLGIDEARARLKIYATDADEEALSEARSAVFSTRRLESVPEELRAKYFERVGDRWTFHRELRRNIIFGRHDLLQDAPISRIDLLTCRNALMYFNSKAQTRILARFHFALGSRGFLFLGKSETLLAQTKLFSPVDLGRRIFAKTPDTNGSDRLMFEAHTRGEPLIEHLVTHTRVREAAADAVPTAQIVLDTSGEVLQINARAREIFSLSSKDIGRPLQDLEISYRPVELRSLVAQAHAEGKTQTVRDVEWPAGGGGRSMEVEIVPLYNDGAALGTGVSFHDVSLPKKLQDELQHANQELETTLEELQSTNEELETTNEELQSTNEELETTNEELQSTNEELETMNEELQSTNEELQTINEEARLRADELDQVNNFLQAILGSLRGGVAVLDGEMQIMVWNTQMEEMWGLRADEVRGKHLMNLDIGLPVDTLKNAIRACMADEESSCEKTLEATNRRGKSVSCRCTITPLRAAKESQPHIGGVILVIEEG